MGCMAHNAEPPEVRFAREMIRYMPPWALMQALEAETSEGGSLWDDSTFGHCNPALILCFTDIIQRCPAHAQHAVRQLAGSQPGDKL